MITVLFLCTGNSCRSQMAEGFLRHLGGDRFLATSAGIEAHGKNPRAVQVMQEVDIDISDQASKIVTNEMIEAADLVVTVCGDADERCPLLPPGTRRTHWPLADPSQAIGSESEILIEFRKVRDEIRQQVLELIDNALNGGTL